MARYGVSLDVGKDLDNEEKHEKAVKEYIKESAKPIPKDQLPKRKPMPKTDAPLPVEIGEDWIYLVGALAIIAALIGLFLWSQNGPIAEQVGITQGIENATAADVDAVLNQLVGEKLTDNPSNSNSSEADANIPDNISDELSANNSNRTNITA